MDWARVKELQNDLGEEDFEEIITLFLEEVEDRLASLAAGDFGTFAEDLHFLKGSAANLGFASFRSQCEALEQSRNTQAVPELSAVYARSKAEFLANLKTREGI
ncbi:HPt (histidine-containing phosphotransfer) domain-containing protein [Litoreibacter ponti]|uniref:HPt (Histidine-containing phosphotransfer) domain-containing protein n=1 Tax=Litoreibacter ponti TaxID=1510457 RepID=A0A2T6BPT8_9RHOB|nr:Hpt domain-containing protein [Litoreibacter ponti]PTX58054.1 HPt (histidine-containing phosphotransfer) domain-containing protein [Litoreibacter ponti]